MPAKTFYLLTTAAVTPDWGGRMSETNPGGGSNTTFGFVNGNSAELNCYGRIGATTPSSGSNASPGTTLNTLIRGTNNTNLTASNFFRIGPYTGIFDAGVWTFNFNMRCSVTGGQGRIQARLWASTDSTGLSARSLTVVGNINCSNITLSSTTADFNSTLSPSLSQMILDNEYLFLAVEWIIVAGGSTANALFRVPTSTIVSANFTAGLAVPQTNAIVMM